MKYYQDVVHTLGGGFEGVQESVRLFMAPGMHHCGNGPGPNVLVTQGLLANWVENGVEPDQILAIHSQNNDPSTGVVTRTMPLCPYPEVAVFTGGDVNVVANWVCQRHANQPSSSGPKK